MAANIEAGGPVDQSLSHVVIDDIENALTQVAEIKAARIVTSPEGVIQEIHVLALPSKTPKQIVRDIESTVMAQFGIPIDHRKISIAQLGQDAIPKADADEVGSGVRARIISINSNVAGVHAATSVTLEIEGDEYVGHATSPASQTARQRLIAEATLNAVEAYAHGGMSFALEDVALTQLGHQRVAVACVVLVTPLGEQAYAGSALVRQNENDSIVRATLDAINRRIGFLTTA